MMNLKNIKVSKWLNSPGFDWEKMQGKVVAIHAFQMLCPGCVLHGIPQAQKMHAIFNEDSVRILGLHTVFEHHEAMTEVSLKAFLSEFRVNFPVGIDEPSKTGSIPETMKTFSMQGTPTWLIFDREGNLQFHAFGQVEDAVLGAEISRLSLNARHETPLYR